MGQEEDAIRRLLSERGRLLEVVCEANPQAIRMFFERGQLLGECSKGYFMQFGYWGTGPRYFWQFLQQAGVDISYDQVTKLKAPVTLRPKWSTGRPRRQHPAVCDGDYVKCGSCGTQAKVRIFEPGKIALLGPDSMASMNRDNTALMCQDCGYIVCFSCASSRSGSVGIPTCPSCKKQGGPYFFTTADVMEEYREVQEQVAPDGLVPCPICKVGVKPPNLERHKSKCTILERAREEQRAKRREEMNRRSQEIQKHREEEAKRREEEDARTKAEEERRAQVQARRKSDGRCVMCGNPLGFFQRLLGKDRHGPCTEFRD